MRCCSGVGGLLMTSCTCIQIFMPNNTMEKCRSYLAFINKWHAAAKENCCSAHHYRNKSRVTQLP